MVSFPKYSDLQKVHPLLEYRMLYVGTPKNPMHVDHRLLLQVSDNHHAGKEPAVPTGEESGWAQSLSRDDIGDPT
jgi:hypothetical protein